MDLPGDDVTAKTSKSRAAKKQTKSKAAPKATAKQTKMKKETKAAKGVKTEKETTEKKASGAKTAVKSEKTAAEPTDSDLSDTDTPSSSKDELAGKRADPRNKKPLAPVATKKAASKKAPAKKEAKSAATKKAKSTSAGKKSNTITNGAQKGASTARKRKAEETLEEQMAKKAKTLIKGPIINEVPTQVYDILVCGEGANGELGLGTAAGTIDVKRPRLHPFLDAKIRGSGSDRRRRHARRCPHPR